MTVKIVSGPDAQEFAALDRTSSMQRLSMSTYPVHSLNGTNYMNVPTDNRAPLAQRYQDREQNDIIYGSTPF
ncbi:unnamed protein product [Anisakis simplex]|uniref:Catalase n=1 Tax=Anisakis simplex TaxID=6269 RepID=A0A0M3KEX4_ANISI|nr:unnamed protein product [Anisakis simplex]